LKILIILVAAASLLTAAEDAPLNGKWQIHSSIAGNDSDQACTFAQKDKDLTGTCTSDNGTVNIAGKIDGKKVTWTYKSEYNGSPLTVNYEGTVSVDNKIAGTVNVPEYSADGDFTAIPSK
jgi:hypothetical protein